MMSGFDQLVIFSLLREFSHLQVLSGSESEYHSHRRSEISPLLCATLNFDRPLGIDIALRLELGKVASCKMALVEVSTRRGVSQEELAVKS